MSGRTFVEFSHGGRRYRAWWEALEMVGLEKRLRDAWLPVLMPGAALLAAGRAALKTAPKEHLMSPMTITTCAFQHIGLRDEQEDRYLVRADIGLVAVLDGLGGHEDGAQAAQAAVDVLVKATGPASSHEMRTLFHEAHDAVVAIGPRCEATGERGQHKMSCGCRKLPGTTLTALWIDGPRAVIGHIGGTRIWRVRGGEAVQLTTDHSQWNMLLRSLGGRGEDPPDVMETDVQPGDVFVLVSDGVHLTGEQIAEVLACGPFEQAAERLVEAGQAEYAKRSPRCDNASAVCVRVEAAP